MSNAPAKASTVVLSRKSAPGQDIVYHQWHQEVVAIAQGFEGLISVNLYDPIDSVQDQWVQMISFDSVDHLQAFLNDETYKTKLVDSQARFDAPITQQVIASAKPAAVPVTVVISQLLKPGFEAEYQKWQLEIDRAAKTYPGFLGTEMIKPVPGVQNEWVVVFRFDSTKHLDDWFASQLHDQLMKQAEPFFEKVHVRRVGRGFEDWFANAAGDVSGGPSQWKMAMVVLLTLYPTVMLLTLFVGPLFADWPLPYAMFASNVLSVVILTALIMPLVTRALGFWLDEETGSKTSTTVFGAGMILMLYAVMVALFVAVTG